MENENPIENELIDETSVDVESSEQTESANDIENIYTLVDGADETDVIKITNVAIEKVNIVMDENDIADEYKLRLGTRSGGCSGMNYTIGFDNNVLENDKIFKVRNLEIVIDKKSMFYLMGVTLDYVVNDHGEGFVFDNPFHEKTCGCHH